MASRQNSGGFHVIDIGTPHHRDTSHARLDERAITPLSGLSWHDDGLQRGMINFTPLSGSSSDGVAGHAERPCSYLLEVDEVRILLDLGGHDPRKPSTSAVRTLAYEEKIRELSPSISLVLLSHSQSTYLGLYPYARTHWGLRCPVYATQPTVEMGRVVCLEEVLSWRNELPVEDATIAEDEENERGDAQHVKLEDGRKEEGGMRGSTPSARRPLRGPFICTAEEVNEAFNWVKAIRYNQPVHMSGMLSHLLLTPYSSGHTLGGTVFKIRSPTSGTVVYAVGINHTTERHLDATVLLPGGAGKAVVEGLHRPDLLIAEGGRSLIIGAKQKDKAKALLDLVTTTLRTGHSLLFPVDASPRLLELLILLDQHWSYQVAQDAPMAPGSGWHYPLCLVSRTAHEMLAFARSLIEWMGANVAKEEDAESRPKRRRGRMTAEWMPLIFRHIQFFPTADALMRALPPGLPKLVLAVPISLNHGSSRLLFKSMAARKGNVVVLTGRSESDTLATDLFERWNLGQSADETRYGAGSVGSAVELTGICHISIDEKVPLAGEELEKHLETERIALEKAAAAKAAAERSRRMLEADDLESDSDSDASSADGHLDGDATGPSSGPKGLFAMDPRAGDAFAETDDVRATSFDIYVKGQQTRAAGFFRSGGTSTGASQRFRMFPFVEKKGRKVDIYGENLDVSAWLRKGREIELEIEPEEVREAKRRRKEEELKQQEAPEPPSKYVHEEFDVELAALVAFIDMEGQHDGRAIKTIIPMLNPRRLIVVKSSEPANQDLASSLSTSISPDAAFEAYYPCTNQLISIGEQTQQWAISLSEGLMAWVNGSVGHSSRSNEKWSKYEDFEIAMVTGRVIRSTDASAIVALDLPKQREAIESADNIKPDARQPAVSASSAQQPEEDQGMLHEDAVVQDEDDAVAKELLDIKPFYANATQDDNIPVDGVSAVATLPQSLFIGDLRLTVLKAALAEVGIPADFVGEGTLLCGSELDRVLSGDLPTAEGALDLVIVRKGADGSIELEGVIGDGADEDPVKDTYAAIQTIVYGAFATIIV